MHVHHIWYLQSPEKALDPWNSTSNYGYHGDLQEQLLLLLWSHPQLQSSSVCNDKAKAHATPVWVTQGHITKSDELKALAVRAGNCLSESYTHETLELGRGLEPERMANA